MTPPAPLSNPSHSLFRAPLQHQLATAAEPVAVIRFRAVVCLLHSSLASLLLVNPLYIQPPTWYLQGYMRSIELLHQDEDKVSPFSLPFSSFLVLVRVYQHTQIRGTHKMSFSTTQILLTLQLVLNDYSLKKRKNKKRNSIFCYPYCYLRFLTFSLYLCLPFTCTLQREKWLKCG